MKTYKNLYAQSYAFDNLYAAFRRARRSGKRKKEAVANVGHVCRRRFVFLPPTT
jgi:hypothetical protein